MPGPYDFVQVHVDKNNVATIVGGIGFLSNIVDCGGTTLCGLRVAEPLQNTQLFFRVALTPEDVVMDRYYYPDGSRIAVTVPAIAPGTFAAIQVPPSWFAGVRFIQIETSAPPISNATVELMLRPV